MTGHCFLYVTTKSRDQAISIGRALVEERLAACVNIGPQIDSIYHWQGKIEQDHEVVLIVKTTKAGAEKAIERVKELHSYECPCVVAFDITAGSKDYLRWIDDAMGTPES